MHRVVPRTTEARYSTPYFFNPLRDAILEPIEGLLKEKPKYKAFAWKDYIRGRVEDNYQDLGEDDIQIERFKII
jgi:isopenicillin N synthase-like dioxygenase